MGYLLSIVIPTKNRYPYLKEVIELIASFKNDEIELVIQDNNEDNSEFLDYLKTNQFPNIKYDHIKEAIPIYLNSDKAILNSSGEYVCFIGDDDAVTRNIIECVKWMKREGIDVLKTQYALYKWPSYKDGRVMQLASTLALGSATSEIKYIDPVVSLKEMIAGGFTSIAKMPKVYNGIVKRSILDQIYTKTGTYFPGPSPDMANAVALSLIKPKYCYLNFPVIIGGQCASVGGGARLVKNGYKKLSEIPFLPKNFEEIWEKFLPKIWCVETVWPESGIKAIKAMDNNEFLSLVNKEQLLSIFVAYRPWIKEMALELSDSPKKMLLNGKLFAFKLFLKNIYYLLKYKLQGRTPEDLKIYRNISNIKDAEEFINSRYPKFPY